MAQIKATTTEKIFSLNAFKGLNQNPDGDTKLKMGEAAVVRNFRITRDGNLQRRPGTHTLVDLETDSPVKGLWVGFVNDHEYMLGACNGKLYQFWDDVSMEFAATEIGAIDTTKDVTIFPFSNIVYILDGSKYWQWDGTTLSEVVGYRPLVWIAIGPVNSLAVDESSALENINRLNGQRRVWISPDGTGKRFKFPEEITGVDYVLDFLTGENLPTSDYSVDLENHEIVFNDALPQAVNSHEIGYSVAVTYRSQVEHMQYAELYAGQQDTRVFLYGDGSNRCLYSAIDYNGNPRADYFPDLYECRVGDENTPITGMIRHYSALICYKSNSAWSITATSVTLADNLKIPAFYVGPINRTIGNVAPGQVRLILNSPYTLFGDDLYEWKNNSYYSSNLNSDERQAKRVSDRIWAGLRNFDRANSYCYDDNDSQEYYICYDGKALVYNYAADAWSYYTQFPVSCMVNLHGDLYIGSPDGKVKHFNYNWLSDDGTAISAYWESGSMSFGQDYMRKYAAMLWVGIKPEGVSEVYVTVQTDRNSQLNEKVVESTLSTFAKANFARWSFSVNRKPHMKRLKIKAKKFVFYKLIFKCTSADTRATILAADIRVRMTGYAK